MPPRRACDVCYKRKIQCLIKTPGEPCDWCGSQGLACTFERVIQKAPGKRTTSDIVQALSHRVEELESALRSTSSQSPNAPTEASASGWSDKSFGEVAHRHTASTGASPATGLGEQTTTSPFSFHAPSPHVNQSESLHQLSRCQLGNNWYFKGVGIFSSRGRQWIAEGAGQRVFLENFDIFRSPISTQSGLDPITTTRRPRKLPPMTTCRYLLELFFKSATSMIFPVLHRELLEGTISRAYESPITGSPHQASAEACIWAVLAFVSRAEEAQQFITILDSDECAQEARHLLVATNGAANLDNLEATILLWAYLQMKGRCREAATTFSSACRMVCDLGGHFLLSGLVFLPQHIPIYDEPSRSHIRSLFCLCYCFDKDNSLRIGTPPLLTSDYCDVSYPGDRGNRASWFNQARDLNLAKIKEDASRLLLSPRAFKYTDGELISHVRQLDDELEEWRLSIEPHYRPRLSIPPDTPLSPPPNIKPEDRTHIIKLQLDYLFTMINIHTLVRKCGDFERNLPDDLHAVVHSSADLSIEASRSIFRFLGTVVDLWKEDSVWVVSHYAPMASMPLFLNILIHPLGETADNDLKILGSIDTIARKVPTERLSKREIEHVQEIVEFVTELVRLGHNAAWKAKKGEREVDLDIIHR